jgi:hypothetical protein
MRSAGEGGPVPSRKEPVFDPSKSLADIPFSSDLE